MEHRKGRAMYWNGVEWWAWIPMTVVMVAFWAAVIWGVVALVGARRSGEPRARTAREILDERLARGEIDIAEYEERWAVLEGRHADLTPFRET
jgi:putative membrane protein